MHAARQAAPAHACAPVKLLGGKDLAVAKLECAGSRVGLVRQKAFRGGQRVLALAAAVARGDADRPHTRNRRPRRPRRRGGLVSARDGIPPHAPTTPRTQRDRICGMNKHWYRAQNDLKSLRNANASVLRPGTECVASSPATTTADADAADATAVRPVACFRRRVHRRAVRAIAPDANAVQDARRTQLKHDRVAVVAPPLLHAQSRRRPVPREITKLDAIHRVDGQHVSTARSVARASLPAPPPPARPLQGSFADLRIVRAQAADVVRLGGVDRCDEAAVARIPRRQRSLPWRWLACSDPPLVCVWALARTNLLSWSRNCDATELATVILRNDGRLARLAPWLLP